MYKNEASVGEALQDLKIDRDDVYITTKYGGGKIIESFETSRKKVRLYYTLRSRDNYLNDLQLGVKQVDLYLIHTPSLVKGNLEGAWRTFEELKKSGATKQVHFSQSLGAYIDRQYSFPGASALATSHSDRFKNS